MTTTAIAPTNIAVLKYWGRARESYNIPTKSSLSFTVKDLFTTTSVEASEGRGRFGLTLNGKERGEGSGEHSYVAGFLDRLASAFPSIKKHDYRIASENNFPTAAGFASSASGFAALTKALAKEVEELHGLDDRKLSALARLGSGSAARSMPSKGGFVKWDRGSGEDWEKDPVFSSYAITLFEPEHWPELRIIYLKLVQEEKKIPSRVGMQESVRTNPLYQPWVVHEEGLVKNDMALAVGDRDFGRLAPMVMQASDSFHSICLGSHPPIHYLTDKSFAIMDAVHRANRDGIRAAYTFDAGPNPVVLTLEEHEGEVAGMLEEMAGEGDVMRTRMGPGPRYTKRHLF